MKAWLDHRTGYKKLLDALLLEHIPGGAKWRYVWGSCLLFVFSIQLITGLLLMTAYSPGDSTAWGSVYFIQYEMEFGWLIRGLHHFGSQAMVVLLGLHMLQVVIAGAQLPPREFNWWLGLALMGAVLGLSLTGYLLPWDQKGYWATQVATSIAGNLPGIGSFVKRVLVGGPEYGNHTLTRFYALHVGILPPTVIGLVIIHIVLFRRHGVTAPKNAVGESLFWPDQAFKDLVASLAVFGVLWGVVVFGGHGHAQRSDSGATLDDPSWYERIAYAGKTGSGADLDAPADPQEQYPARPEWYFLFLFQLLKYFEGDRILVGTVFIPNGVAVIVFLLPLFGYGRMRPVGHILGVLVVVAVLTAAASLTCLAIADDTPDPVARKLLEDLAFLFIPAVAGVLLLQLALLASLPWQGFRKSVFVAGSCVLAILVIGAGAALYAAVTNNLPEMARAQLASQVQERPETPSEQTKKSLGFRKQVEHAEENANRAVQLAYDGIPEGGGALLLQRDPLTAGKRLFVLHCGGCHNLAGASVTGMEASDLTDFGTKEWIRQMLENPSDPRFFGRTNLQGMKSWSSKHHDYRKALLDEMAELAGKGDDKSKEERAEARKALASYDAWLDRVVDWLATQPTGKPKEEPKTPAEKKFADGYAAFFDKKIKQGRCSSCHTYAGEGGSEGPDLTGYGSADWIRLMIVAPAHPMRHGAKNKMTAFRNDQGPGAEILLQELAQVAGDKFSPLSDVDRELIIRFILHDNRMVFFGRPITGPEFKKK
jgi:quinol-cytochrome oxidoreductase complex cytochrome b subunit/mono/diheme cytochrome c family protein